MFEEFLKTLNTWNSTKSERQKLQHTYLALTLVIILISGVISLFRTKYGHDVVKLAVASVVIYGANAIVWGLLESSIINKLSSRPRKR
jgi:membrane associated rhomboid family serine protease